MKDKKFVVYTLSMLCVLLVLLGGLNVVIDPFFHYHKPQTGIAYILSSQRYQNDGIVRNFDYNAIITGTSMTENFKTSEFDSLFKCKSVKVPLEGSTLKETYNILDRAFKSNADIKYVVRSLDNYALLSGADQVSDFEYPQYLYDDNIFNDVKYILNKTVLLNHTLKTLYNTFDGADMTTFDEYSNWSSWMAYGKQPVMERFIRPEKIEKEAILDTASRERIIKNIESNVISLAKEHPNTEFYVFFPPYSIFNWDIWNQSGTLKYQIEVMEVVTEVMLEYENIHIYSFYDDIELICNLDNYKDNEHYGEWINSQILVAMENGSHKLEKDNYKEHFNYLLGIYSEYDYDKLYIE